MSCRYGPYGIHTVQLEVRPVSLIPAPRWIQPIGPEQAMAEQFSAAPELTGSAFLIKKQEDRHEHGWTVPCAVQPCSTISATLRPDPRR